MCILRIPKHPWCHCTDPTEIDVFESLCCPHHIWISPDCNALTTPHTTTTPQSRLDNLLTNIPRPSPSWCHCPTYITTYTRPSGLLITGNERLCPGTHRYPRREGGAEAFKEFYIWDGLCSDCDDPERGIELELVPLRQRWVAAGPSPSPHHRGIGEEEEDEEFVHMVLEGLERPDGTRVDRALEKRLFVNRRAWGGGEGVYVDVVEREVDGWRGILQGRSAVCLLPDYHNLLPEVKEKTGNRWLGKVVGMVKGKTSLS